MASRQDQSTVLLGPGADAAVKRTAAAEVSVTDGAANYATFQSGAQKINGANGGQWVQGFNSELITIAAAATTDSTANLLPANSIIEAVVILVTTVIPTAATFTYGDATTAARFGTGILVAAGTTDIGILQHNTANTNAAGPVQISAAKVRITPNLTPGAATGVLRCTVFYRTFVAPTS